MIRAAKTSQYVKIIGMYGWTFPSSFYISYPSDIGLLYGRFRL